MEDNNVLSAYEQLVIAEITEDIDARRNKKTNRSEAYISLLMSPVRFLKISCANCAICAYMTL